MIAAVVLLMVILAKLLAVIVPAQETGAAVSVPGVVTAVPLPLLTRALGSAALVVLA